MPQPPFSTDLTPVAHEKTEIADVNTASLQELKLKPKSEVLRGLEKMLLRYGSIEGNNFDIE